MQNLRAIAKLPVTVLPEVAHLIDNRIGHHAMRQFVARLDSPAWDIVDLHGEDIARTHAVLEDYQSLKLDFVDATLIAIAERLNIRTILTLDQRHFRVVRPRHVPAFDLLPA